MNLNIYLKTYHHTYSKKIYVSKKKIVKEDWSFMISNNSMLINPSNWSDL